MTDLTIEPDVSDQTPMDPEVIEAADPEGVYPCTDDPENCSEKFTTNVGLGAHRAHRHNYVSPHGSRPVVRPLYGAVDRALGPLRQAFDDALRQAGSDLKANLLAVADSMAEARKEVSSDRMAILRQRLADAEKLAAERKAVLDKIVGILSTPNLSVAKAYNQITNIMYEALPD